MSLNMSLNMNVIDVGAGKYRYYESWLGQFSNLRIFSIEPHPVLFARLKELQNKLKEPSKKRLILLNCAIETNTINECKFYLNNDPSTSSTLMLCNENISRWKHPIGRKRLSTVETIVIPTMTLDDLIAQYNIYYVDLLNIDVQGNSLEVIKSLSNYDKIKQINIRVHRVPFELYKNQTTFDEIDKLLKMAFFTCDNTKLLSFDQEIQSTYFNDRIKTKKGYFYFSNS